MPALLHADARALPLADGSVDLVVTSPPYFGLRDYGHGGQIGAEPTPVEFLDALLAVTAECVRVLKPAGSLFVNLGDKYGRHGGAGAGSSDRQNNRAARPSAPRRLGGDKSLALLPERYRIRCVDELGLIARAVLIWSKPNGLPESVTDRVRRSHEDWVHLTKQPRYFSAVDEIREPHARPWSGRNGGARPGSQRDDHLNAGLPDSEPHPRGALPGSVWSIPTQPLNVPAHLDVDHFAAFPMEWPRRLITGWSPREVCLGCGAGRHPVTTVEREHGWIRGTVGSGGQRNPGEQVGQRVTNRALVTVTGYACGCPDTSAPTRPGVVLDPFGGTGTTALVATMLGRTGISVDLSPEYQRLAAWRAADPKERARAAGLDPDRVAAIRPQLAGQMGLFG